MTEAPQWHVVDGVFRYNFIYIYKIQIFFLFIIVSSWIPDDKLAFRHLVFPCFSVSVSPHGTLSCWMFCLSVNNVVSLTDLELVCVQVECLLLLNGHRDPIEPLHGFVLMVLLQKLAWRCETLPCVRSEHITFDDLLSLIMIDKNKQGELIVFPHGNYERLTRKAHQ